MPPEVYMNDWRLRECPEAVSRVATAVRSCAIDPLGGADARRSRRAEHEKKERRHTEVPFWLGSTFRSSVCHDQRLARLMCQWQQAVVVAGSWL
jgi:hypothetical protein